MSLAVFNSMGNRKEPFVPLVPGKVGMYVCGVTVYDLCHIGHARANVAFDIIVRYLRFSGYEVTYVRNFTDIDDKILKRAREEGSDYLAVSTKYIEAFHEDFDGWAFCGRPRSRRRPSTSPRSSRWWPTW
jgi:cysteinyl-tRNA synthetase